MAGCVGSGGQHDVFTVLSATRQSEHTQVNEINAQSLPELYNTSGSPVRLLSVKLAGQRSAVHLLNVRAYSVKQVGYGGGSWEGDLPSECPAQFVPHRIESFTFPPHRLAAYFVVIEFTISKPGIYHIGRVKMHYATDGTQGWQYKDLNLTMIVRNPPLPGPLPVPRSGVCGRP